MKISIIIPAYNEEKRIGKTLESYHIYFENLRKSNVLDYEILVSINNTKDRTEEIVKEFNKKNRRIKYLNLIKGGKGYAVMEGFKHSLKENSNLIGFVDADLATSPEEFYKLIKGINGYNAVIASRYIKGSKIHPKFSFRRLIVARIFNFLVRSLFLMPYEDTQCGAKLFDKKAISLLIKYVKMSQYAFDVEILYHLRRNGMLVHEIPTVWHDVESSKLQVGKSSLQMLMAVIRLRVIRSPFRRLLKPISPVIALFWRLTK